MPVTSTTATSSLPRKPYHDELRHVGEVDVDVLHLARVDLRAADRVGLVGQPQLDAVDLGQGAVQLGAVEAPVQTPIWKPPRRVVIVAARAAGPPWGSRRR